MVIHGGVGLIVFVLWAKIRIVANGERRVASECLGFSFVTRHSPLVFVAIGVGSTNDKVQSTARVVFCLSCGVRVSLWYVPWRLTNSPQQLDLQIDSSAGAA